LAADPRTGLPASVSPGRPAPLVEDVGHPRGVGGRPRERKRTFGGGTRPACRPNRRAGNTVNGATAPEFPLPKEFLPGPRPPLMGEGRSDLSIRPSPPCRPLDRWTTGEGEALHPWNEGRDTVCGRRRHFSREKLPAFSVAGSAEGGGECPQHRYYPQASWCP
jgi:hypothetical protein